MSDDSLFRVNDNGQISCARHPDSWDPQCGMCNLASAMERGRQRGLERVRQLAFTYLQDGLTPEEAAAKAKDNYYRLAELI